jgi:hypothetical protein
MGGDTDLDLESWCSRTLPEHRRILAEEVARALAGIDGLLEVSIEVGSIGREYDLTAVVETDAGRLRTPLWSHARAMIFCDPSIHPANRRQLSPALAARQAADRLRRRLRVPYKLESRGLTITIEPEEGVVRTWTAEHSRFRSRTAVVREDRVERADEVDVRDLLAHFYSGPSLRLVSESGESLLLPGASEAEGPLVTLCAACRRWSEGAVRSCPDCGSTSVDWVIAARSPRR